MYARRAARLHGQAFLCNSGAEANEAALKLARRYQSVVVKAPDRTEIIAFDHSFHGRTVGALSVTGQPKYHAGFEPLIPDVTFAPFGDIDAVKELVSDRTCAIIVEPIQAEGGIVVPPAGYLAALRRLCDEAGVVLIFDEVQTGVGRTGTFYAFEQENAVPDILTLAKGIAGGVPMGATLAAPKVVGGFEPGSHASTFGGNALASAAALHVQEQIDERGLLDNVVTVGRHLHAGLSGLADKYGEDVLEVHGRGLLLGLALRSAQAAGAVHVGAREAGLLISLAGGNVVRFVPPLIVTTEQIDEALGILDGVLASVFAEVTRAAAGA